jgi:hypothetical protein
MASDLEITGKVIKFLDVQKGESSRGPWQKGGFVIETDGAYPRKVCLQVWGDSLNQVNNLKEGDTVKASINIESREYNNRWYTDVRVWRFNAVEGGSSGTGPGTTGATSTGSYTQDTPKTEGQYADIRQDSSSEGEGADDLPF